MIKFLHALFIRDWPLKVVSLALATLTWMAVTFSREKQVIEVKGSPTLAKRTFFDLPIFIVSADTNVSAFKAKPSEVDVAVQGDGDSLKTLESSQLRVLVDLTGALPATNSMRRINVITPPGITLLQLTPEETEIIPPPSKPLAPHSSLQP